MTNVNRLKVQSGVRGRDDLDWLTFDDCKTAGLPVRDEGRAKLAQRPWAEREPAAAAAEANPWKAFRLKHDADAGVFTADKKPVPLGVAFGQADGVRRAYPDVVVWAFTRPKTAGRPNVPLIRKSASPVIFARAVSTSNCGVETM